MTKAQVKELAEKYDMQIMRNRDTQKAFGLVLDANHEIPELDALLGGRYKGVMIGRYDWFDNMKTYRIDCPHEWFDQNGWVE